VSDIIKQSGGKVFIAHVFRYLLEDYEAFLDTLVKEKIIDGIEVYHSSFTEKECEFLKDYCIKNCLLMSGGSDCHGEKKSNRKIGKGYGNMNISKDLIKNWI
jgi:predicted metal-dependent phosphoesterase TrpH